MKDGRIGNDLSQNGRIPGGEVVWQIITCKRRKKVKIRVMWPLWQVSLRKIRGGSFPNFKFLKEKLQHKHYRMWGRLQPWGQRFAWLKRLEELKQLYFVIFKKRIFTFKIRNMTGTFIISHIVVAENNGRRVYDKVNSLWNLG